MPGAPIHPSGTHLDEDLVRRDGGLVGFGQTQNVGGAIGVLDDRTHHILLAVPPWAIPRHPTAGCKGQSTSSPPLRKARQSPAEAGL